MDERATGSQDQAAPGERPAGSRRLAEAPSSRYAAAAGPGGTPESLAPTGSALPGPLLRASLVAVAGAALLVLLGAILASTAGLLFAAGVTGAAIGLVLARAAVPGDQGGTAVPRRRLAWIAIGLTLAAVAAAALATWLIARQEGGTLGFVDYLLETFGPFVPAEAVVGALAAWWGASSGPVQR